MFHVFFYGPLRVLVCDATGAVVAVQDRTSAGYPAAALRFSPAYIASAEAFALNAFESLFSEA